LVIDDQEVKRGDVLFRVDPERFQVALQQAEAIVDGKKEADMSAPRPSHGKLIESGQGPAGVARVGTAAA